MSGWIKKQDPTICCQKEIHCNYKDILRLRLKEWRIICHANTTKKKVRVAILIIDRADFRARKIIREKEGHHLMTKGSILQEYVTILNVHVPNNTTSKYVRQTLVEL